MFSAWNRDESVIPHVQVFCPHKVACNRQEMTQLPGERFQWSVKYVNKWGLLENSATGDQLWAVKVLKTRVLIYGKGDEAKYALQSPDKQVEWISHLGKAIEKVIFIGEFKGSELRVRLVRFKRMQHGAAVFWEFRGFQEPSDRTSIAHRV